MIASTSTHRTLAKKLTLLALLCWCLIFSAAPVTSDRDESKYFLRLRKNHARTNKKYPNNQIKYSYGNDDRDAKIRIRPKSRTRSSVFVRSFILTAFVWTVKFAMPQTARLFSQWCKDISKFRRVLEARAKETRRHRRLKSHSEVGEATVSTDTVSFSSSIKEIMELAEGGDDDGSSFISATSSFSTVLLSLGSFVTSRGRKYMPLRPSRSKPIARHSKQNKSKSSKSKSSKSSKRQTYVDDEIEIGDGVMRNSLPNFLQFTDEDDASIGASGEEIMYTKDSKKLRSKENHSNRWLDDISHLPATGNGFGIYEYYAKRKHHESDSILEQKLTVESPHDSEILISGHSHQNRTRREKHKSSSSHRNHGHRCHRERSRTNKR